MKGIQLLDCTLREAPVDNFFLGEKFMKEFIRRCENARLDIIECGFLKNGNHEPGSNCFQTAEQFARILPCKQNGILYVALMDCGRYDLSTLSPYDGSSIDGVRVCFKHGEQEDALLAVQEIQKKGYKAFLQHVDTLAYTDIEIIKFIEKVNKVKPYSYAIVDTFGSMYEDELNRLTMLVNYHLSQDILLGFHAHNNLMLANANAQSFLSMYAGKRNIMVDTSVLGCGRGAGNANTELMVEFLNRKYYKNYNINEILDLIDDIMPALQEMCSWGYGIPYFLSGVHSAHVYNVNHLLRRHNIALKDLRAIIGKLDDTQKKSYDYTLLEKLYVEYFSHPVNDEPIKARLRKDFRNKKILLLAPGKTLQTEKKQINTFIKENCPLVIGVHDEIADYDADYLFFSSANRYSHYSNKTHDEKPYIIVTSNIISEPSCKKELIVNYESLIKFGWINIDSSMIMLLRLIVSLGINNIYVAGFDGFTKNKNENYYSQDLVTDMKPTDLLLITKENQEMLADMQKEYPELKLEFITTSIYAK